MFTNLTWKDLVDGGFVIAGSPATVVDRMKDMITTLRLGHVFCLMHNGNQPDWKTRYSTKLFAEQVMPKLRNMWPDHDGDDRWWIKPLDDRVRGDETVAVRPPRSAGAERRWPVVTERSERPTHVDRELSPPPSSPPAAGIEATVLTGGPDGGTPVVAFHGFTGPLGGEPALVRLADAGFRVFAPVWPGYSDTGGEGADRRHARLRPARRRRRRGARPRARRGAPRSVTRWAAMIAAEMAALAPYGYGQVVLIDPLGLWLDEHPIPDIYTLLPYEFPPLLFHDAAAGTALLAGGGVDFGDRAAIQRFLIGNNRRLGTAGKILFPIPNRRLSQAAVPDHQRRPCCVWGDDDRLLPAPYAEAWAAGAAPRRRRATDRRRRAHGPVRAARRRRRGDRLVPRA